MKYFKDPILWLYIYLPLMFFLSFCFIQVSKLRSEIVMCQTYYKEISTWDCYWMPKQLPVKR
jgi:hypothetical protein